MIILIRSVFIYTLHSEFIPFSKLEYFSMFFGLLFFLVLLTLFDCLLLEQRTVVFQTQAHTHTHTLNFSFAMVDSFFVFLFFLQRKRTFVFCVDYSFFLFDFFLLHIFVGYFIVSPWSHIDCFRIINLFLLFRLFCKCFRKVKETFFLCKNRKKNTIWLNKRNDWKAVKLEMVKGKSIDWR